MPKITIILEILSDGKWHQMEELMLQLNLNEAKILEVTSFLKAFSFVKVDMKKRRVRINSDFKKLLI